jgi:hypothetical protein
MKDTNENTNIDHDNETVNTESFYDSLSNSTAAINATEEAKNALARFCASNLTKKEFNKALNNQKNNAEQKGGNDNEPDDAKSLELFDKIVTKVGDGFCKKLEENSKQVGENIQNFIISNTNYEDLNQHFTNVFIQKFNDVINKIQLKLISTNDISIDKTPQSNEQSITPHDQSVEVNETPAPDNESEDNESEDNESEDNESEEPDNESEDNESKEPDNESKEPDNESKEPDNEETTGDNTDKKPTATGPENVVTGGNKSNKKKTIRVKYLSKNKTRKNLI